MKIKKTVGIVLSLLMTLALLGACCNDAQVKELREDSAMHEQGLRNAQEEESIIYVYIEYNRLLDNTMPFAGHYWDTMLSEISFAVLLGVLALLWLLVKRVRIIYKLFDGSRDIPLNTACAVALSMNIASFFDLDFKAAWSIPAAIITIGIILVIIAVHNPYMMPVLNSRWLKYLRRLYLILYAAFVVMCLVNEPVLAPSVY